MSKQPPSFDFLGATASLPPSAPPPPPQSHIYQAVPAVHQQPQLTRSDLGPLFQAIADNSDKGSSRKAINAFAGSVALAMVVGCFFCAKIVAMPCILLALGLCLGGLIANSDYSFTDCLSFLIIGILALMVFGYIAFDSFATSSRQSEELRNAQEILRKLSG